MPRTRLGYNPPPVAAAPSREQVFKQYLEAKMMLDATRKYMADVRARAAHEEGTSAAACAVPPSSRGGRRRRAAQEPWTRTNWEEEAARVEETLACAPPRRAPSTRPRALPPSRLPIAQT